VNTDGSPNLAGCCQICLTAAIPVAPLTVSPPVNGEVFTVVRLIRTTDHPKVS
jgi:hypothetical protein